MIKHREPVAMVDDGVSLGGEVLLEVQKREVYFVPRVVKACFVEFDYVKPNFKHET